MFTILRKTDFFNDSSERVADALIRFFTNRVLVILAGFIDKQFSSYDVHKIKQQVMFVVSNYR